MKENTGLEILDELKIDREDPRNTGIVSDEVGVTKNSHKLRKIVYIEPATGKRFVFLTTEMTLLQA